MKREGPTNSKMRRLQRRLDIRLYQAVGILELLWHTCAREAPRSDIGKLSDEDIALAIDWPGDEHALIDALVATGWLDVDDEHRLLVHDWAEHADQACKNKLEYHHWTFVKPFVGRKPKNIERNGDNLDAPRARAGPEPEPEPPDTRLQTPERESPSAQPALPPDGGVSLVGIEDGSGLKSKSNSVQARAPSAAFVECYKQHRGALREISKFTAQRALALSERRRRGLTLDAWRKGVIKAAESFLGLRRSQQVR